jgi:NDP-sugar pyrophosphorylase family protein
MTVLVDPDKNDGTPVFGHADGLVAGVGDSAISFNRVGSSAMLLAAEQSFRADCEEALEEGSTQVVSVINRIVSEGKPVRYAIVRQQWFDVDGLSALVHVNHHLLEHMTASAPGTVFVSSGNEVDQRSNLPPSVKLDVGSKVTGPALVCESSVIGAGATVGPFAAIGRNSRVGARATVIESVLFGGAQLPAGARVEKAVVYRKTVYRSESEYVSQ